MDGKLVVLCGERPTINQYGDRIDKQGDKCKKVIDGMDLLNDMMTESTESDIIFVDWETIVPSDIEPMREMISCAMSTQHISPQMIFKSGKNQSILKRAYMDRLLLLDKFKERPCFDYQFQAMEDFMQLFSKTLEKNGVVSILPTFPNSDDESINRARLKVIRSWEYRNEMRSKYRGETKIDVLSPMSYKEFGEIYARASDEMLKIISKPDWYEMKSEEQDEGEPGGRD